NAWSLSIGLSRGKESGAIASFTKCRVASAIEPNAGHCRPHRVLRIRPANAASVIERDVGGRHKKGFGEADSEVFDVFTSPRSISLKNRPSTARMYSFFIQYCY